MEERIQLDLHHFRRDVLLKYNKKVKKKKKTYAHQIFDSGLTNLLNRIPKLKMMTNRTMWGKKKKNINFQK